MTAYSTQFFEILEALDFKPEQTSASSLLLVKDNNISNLSPRELFSLETAKSFEADAIYFRKFEDSRQPIAQIYIYDNTTNRLNEGKYAEIHKILWSSCVVPLFIIIETSQVLIFDSRKPVDTSFFNEIAADPIQTLKVSSQALKEYSAKLFDNGTFWENEKNSDNFLESTSAYNDLIDGLKKIRKSFLEKSELPPRTAHKLLVLSILIKYLEERGDDGETLFAKNFFRQFGAEDFCGVLRKKGQIVNLFSKLSEHFNGKIFAWDNEVEIEILRNSDLSLLANFLDANIQNNQYVLWRRYSFNHLPVEIISNVYEEFLGEGKKDVVYTPHFLVNMLVDECMPLNDPKENYKLIDVSCGSGIFLVSGYKRLIEWWRFKKYNETGILPPNPNLRTLKQLLKKSIYGIDIEEDATRLTTFSLALALCDLLTPKQIWTELKFDDLSLENILPTDFFKYLKNSSLESFDLVIGNPPFYELNKSEFESIIRDNNIQLACKIPQHQLALLFLDQSMRLLKPTGLSCLIMPSGPLLYNDTLDFRKYFFKEYNVTQIIDFTHLSATLFGKANVATSAIFSQKQSCDIQDIIHITVRRTKASKEKIFFEIDHYDFHSVSKEDAITERYIWKANLFGGGRINYIISRLSQLPTLGDFLKKKRKEKGWFYGDGFIKGKDDGHIVEKKLLEKNIGYKEADFLTNKKCFDPEDFTENGIKKFYTLKDRYFLRARDENIYKKPHLLIKKSLGNKTIPITVLDFNSGFKNEIVGINCPSEDIKELYAIEDRIKNNQTFRFYISITSARSGVSRSIATLLQEDIMNLPYPGNKNRTVLSYAERILRDDVLNYSLDEISRGENAKTNNITKEQDLYQFGEVFCKSLNSVYADNGKMFKLSSIIDSQTFFATIFNYTSKDIGKPTIKTSKQSELSISELVTKQTGKNLRINRVLKIYEKDKVYLIKPKQLRYWLKSIALRDADETLNDLQKAGY
ncbi:MAG: hypothetical protein JWQ09_4547 [Segetibacter sp.]|nr:hypothetical protein [Segetibacter sp.]